MNFISLLFLTKKRPKIEINQWWAFSSCFKRRNGRRAHGDRISWSSAVTGRLVVVCLRPCKGCVPSLPRPKLISSRDTHTHTHTHKKKNSYIFFLLLFCLLSTTSRTSGQSASLVNWTELLVSIENVKKLDTFFFWKKKKKRKEFRCH
jgi:hypothetical protein